MPSQVEKSIRLKESGADGLVADMGSELAAIITHPWGPLGGNLHNNVVVAAALYFQRLGITTVRFNFAGSIGRGYAQVQQVQQVAESLLSGEYSSDESKKPSHLILVGYSYGSLISSSASASVPNCVCTVSIAPPFSVSHWLLLFNSDHHLKQAAAKENIPRLFVIGNNDNFTSESAFKTTVEKNFPTESTTGAIIKNADHFFRSREKDLMDVIGEWLLRTFPNCQGDLGKLRDVEFGLT